MGGVGGVQGTTLHVTFTRATLVRFAAHRRDRRLRAAKAIALTRCVTSLFVPGRLSLPDSDRTAGAIGDGLVPP